MPIATFINKLDRESKDPIELIDEIEQTLQIDVCPVSWPIGMGNKFMGCHDFIKDQIILMNKINKEKKPEIINTVKGLDDTELIEKIPQDLLKELKEQVLMVKELCKPFDQKSYLEGNLTPIYFGSAINTFVVQELLDGLSEITPSENNLQLIVLYYLMKKKFQDLYLRYKQIWILNIEIELHS